MTNKEPDERVCVACECVEHKDCGKTCDCGDWYCDDCRASEWPEQPDGDKTMCAECNEVAVETDKDDEWSWRHR